MYTIACRWRKAEPNQRCTDSAMIGTTYAHYVYHAMSQCIRRWAKAPRPTARSEQSKHSIVGKKECDT